MTQFWFIASSTLATLALVLAVALVVTGSNLWLAGLNAVAAILNAFNAREAWRREFSA